VGAPPNVVFFATLGWGYERSREPVLSEIEGDLVPVNQPMALRRILLGSRRRGCPPRFPLRSLVKGSLDVVFPPLWTAALFALFALFAPFAVKGSVFPCDPLCHLW
jgi:hypothetical protein